MRIEAILGLGAMLPCTVMARQAGAQSGREDAPPYPSGVLTVTLVAPQSVRIHFVPNGAKADFPRIPLVLPQSKAQDRFARHFSLLMAKRR